MFMERKICTELMGRGYEIWKAVTTVPAAHKPQHFLQVFKLCSQERGGRWAAHSLPAPGCFLKRKAAWSYTSRTAVTWLVLNGLVRYKERMGMGDGIRAVQQQQACQAHCHNCLARALSSLAGSCVHRHLLTLCAHSSDAQIVIAYLLAPNNNEQHQWAHCQHSLPRQSVKRERQNFSVRPVECYSGLPTVSEVRWDKGKLVSVGNCYSCLFHIPLLVSRCYFLTFSLNFRNTEILSTLTHVFLH